MTAYNQFIQNKLTSIFEESRKSGDWQACWQRVSHLVLEESNRSFKNGISWAKRHRVGRFPVQYQAQHGNDEVVQEEVEIAGEGE